MTDLDNTQIIGADESLSHESSVIETEASLKIISGADANNYQIGKETVIGRANPSDVVVSAPSLSKQHAKITFANGQYFITDLGSSNKTFQNKIQLQPNVCYALHNGDEIKLGDIVCSFQEQTQTNKNIVPETNVDVIPSTQTISDSYDDQEPTQPMKIWNGNNHHPNRLSRTSFKSSDDVTSKQNGTNDVASNKSSSFVTSTVVSNDPDEDGMVIGAATLPATVPILIEPTQINNDDQLEIVSSSQTRKVVDDDADAVTVETTTTTTTTTTAMEIENTQAYTLEPANDTTAAANPIADTQPYELDTEQVVTDVVETKCEEVHKVVISGDTVIEQITTTTTTTVIESENLPADTLVYDLDPPVEETTTTTTTVETATTVIENNNLPMQTLAYDLQPTEEPVDLDATAPAVCTDTQEYNLEEEADALSPRPASETLEVVPVSKLVEQLEDVEKTSDDTSSKQQVEVIIDPHVGQEVAEKQMETEQAEPASTINHPQESEKSTTDRSQAFDTVPVTSQDADEAAALTTTESEATSKAEEPSTLSTMETEEKMDDSSAASTPEETPLSIPESEENQLAEDEQAQGEDEEPDEAVATTGRGQRGLPRKGARRARGRRGGAAARARVVSTRLHSTRRTGAAAAAAPSVEDDGNNATLEETVNTETEESPKKVAKTPDVEQKPVPTAPVPPSTDESAASSQTNTGSNIRVSARIKARASTGRNRQFPYTDDYVDLDDLEKQSKAASTSQPSTPAATSRRSVRGGRSSSAPQKRISLRQQPIDASASPDEKPGKQKGAAIDVYEQMETGGENEEPDLSTRTIGRKRKSITPVASETLKRTRSVTPQSAPTATTRRQQSSVAEASSTTEATTPKRSRKSAKSASSSDQPPAEPAASDRPVRIALSSHLNFNETHLATLRKLGFEIMDESCHVDALVVDRIRRTKKFFMCLARGAHILAPAWIETMVKENRYVPYEKYYLEDANAETRYGFQLRESVRLAKQHPLFENYKVFCTQDTSPPYEDLKDIVEAAGGKFLDKINASKPAKDLICIVAQAHKNEYEALAKKGVPVVTEEFALSGISKQKLDFQSFSLFQNTATSGKAAGSK